MKKIFSVAVALMMLFALCIPAFAGTAVDALTDKDAKAFAQAVIENGGDLTNEETMTQAVKAGVKAVPVENLAEADRRAEIASLAAAALAADFSLTEDQQTALEAKAVALMEKAYAEKDLGISTFDPSDVVNNIAGGFSDNDLAGLFDTLRNTITDLSDRLSNAFIENSGSGDNTNTDNNNSSNNNTADDTYGGTEPTGDTAVYAVAGVAAVAAVALVLTKKKSK
ncbi:MAG: hypothetical protein MR290_06470 [Ruminococcus sp.]|nr:hypothetical protein [Ruminococcus sp.]